MKLNEESYIVWQKRMEDFRASGLNGLRYCKLHQIPNTTFRDWQKRLANSNLKEDALCLINRNSFVEVESSSRFSEPVLEIKTPGAQFILTRKCNSAVLASMIEQIWRL